MPCNRGMVQHPTTIARSSPGIAKVLFDKESEKILGVHIIGLHAADLIQECSNAIEAGSTLKDLSMMVHTPYFLPEFGKAPPCSSQLS